MKRANVLIAHNKGIYKIKVEGRATFECCPPLRQLAKSIEKEHFDRVSINLERCNGMDSTFMGILAMIGLRARKINAIVEIVNAGEINIELFNGLGLKKLFIYADKHDDEAMDVWSKQVRKESDDPLATAETILDAHKTLMETDTDNITKFKTVVDMVAKDIDEMGNGNSESKN